MSCSYRESKRFRGSIHWLRALRKRFKSSNIITSNWRTSTSRALMIKLPSSSYWWRRKMRSNSWGLRLMRKRCLRMLNRKCWSKRQLLSCRKHSKGCLKKMKRFSHKGRRYRRVKTVLRRTWRRLKGKWNSRRWSLSKTSRDSPVLTKGSWNRSRWLNSKSNKSRMTMKLSLLKSRVYKRKSISSKQI